MAADYVFVGNHDIDFEVPGTLRLIFNYKKWKKNKNGYPLLSSTEYLTETDLSKKMNMIDMYLSDLSEELKKKIKLDKTAVLLINTQNKNGIAEQRKLFVDLINSNIKNPVIIGRTYKNLSDEQLQISSSIDFGSLLLDGLGDGIFINAINSSSDQIINQLSFGILQATRTRISKTEYISCPILWKNTF